MLHQSIELPGKVGTGKLVTYIHDETDFPDKKKYPEARVWLDMAMRWIGQIKE